jgi:RHS repeat-associated protein
MSVTCFNWRRLLVEDFETETIFNSPWILPQWIYWSGDTTGFRLYQGRLTHDSPYASLLVNKSDKEMSDGIVAADVQLNASNATGRLVVRHKNSTYYGVGVYLDRVEIRKVGPYYDSLKATGYFTTQAQTGSTHRIQVTVEGNTLTVLWDGVQVRSWTAVTGSFLNGKVGFQHGGGGPQYGCRWDNIVVTSGVPGQVITAEDFDPWGMVLDGRSYVYGNPDQRYKFTGKERDAESGYDYFGARYYDSRIGRWMSVDPMAEKYPQLSPYVYAGGNPLLFVDPNGKWLAPVHHRMIAVAFKGNDNISMWQDASDFADQGKYQKPDQAYRHAMRQMGLSLESGIQAIDEFLNNDNIEGDNFGVKLHVIMDMTSPSHEGVQEWSGTTEWRGRFGRIHKADEPAMIEIIPHSVKELIPSIRRFFATVRLMREFATYYDPVTKKVSKDFKYFQDKFNEFMGEESDEEREYYRSQHGSGTGY